MHPIKKLKAKMKKCISSGVSLRKDMGEGEEQMAMSEEKPSAEPVNEYDDVSLKAIIHHVSEAQRHMNAAGNIPEWVTGKIAVASQALADVAHFLDEKDPKGVSVEAEPEKEGSSELAKSYRKRLSKALQKAAPIADTLSTPIHATAQMKGLERHPDGTQTLHYGKLGAGNGAQEKSAAVLDYAKLKQEPGNKKIRVFDPKTLKNRGVIKA